MIIIPKSSELTEKEQEKLRTIPKYPEIDSTILTLQAWTRQALSPFNIPLAIELKRDGSNMRLVHLGEDRYGLLSRNQYAADDFINRVRLILDQPYEARYRDLSAQVLSQLGKKDGETPENTQYTDGSARLRDVHLPSGGMLTAIEHIGLFRIAEAGYLVFFELFGRGVFPGFDVDSPPSMEIIDLWTEKTGFLRRSTKEKICTKFHAPLVPLIWKGEVANQEVYWSLIKPIVDQTWAIRKEGVVIKGFLRGYGQLFLKEKHPDAIKESREPRTEKDGQVVTDTRSILDETEIFGAMKKVQVEIGTDKLKDKAIAMPRIAGKVQEECKKHDRRFPKEIFSYYLKYLQKLEEMPDLLALEDIEYHA